MSTSILMARLMTYSQAHDLNVYVEATGMAAYEDIYKEFDVILMGPQVAYRQDEVRKATGMKVAAIPAADYAVGNSAAIFGLVDRL